MSTVEISDADLKNLVIQNAVEESELNLVLTDLKSRYPESEISAAISVLSKKILELVNDSIIGIYSFNHSQPNQIVKDYIDLNESEIKAVIGNVDNWKGVYSGIRAYSLFFVQKKS